MTRVYLTIAAVVVALGAGFFVTQRLQDIGRQDLQIDQLEDNVIIRRMIDEAVRNSPDDRDESLGVLEHFITNN